MIAHPSETIYDGAQGGANSHRQLHEELNHWLPDPDVKHHTPRGHLTFARENSPYIDAMMDDNQRPNRSTHTNARDFAARDSTTKTPAALQRANRELDEREARVADMEAVAADKSRQLRRLNDRPSGGFWDWELGTHNEWYSTRLATLLDYRLTESFPNELMRLLAQTTDASVKATRRVRERIAGAKDFDERLNVLTPDDQPVWLRIRCAVSKDLLAGHYSAGTVEDITDRVLLETERARFAEELERSNAELDAFANIASHDLKAPLRHIGESARQLQQKQDGKTPKHFDTHLTAIQARIGLMNNLLDGLLDYARVGRAKDRIAHIDVQQLLDEVLELLAPPSKIKIELDCAAALLETDAIALQTCLRNILDNAIKHADKNNPCLLLELRDEGTNVVISIHDNGPGVPEQQRAEVFELFRTLEQPDHTRGSGMGLAFVKKCAHAHGGAITIEESELGGACFVLSWPKHAP